VRPSLIVVAGLLGLDLAHATLGALQAAWDTERVLVRLRSHLAAHLPILPPPLGFGPRLIRRRTPAWRAQHAMGPDGSGPSG
jgi:hypothetical protein